MISLKNIKKEIYELKQSKNQKSKNLKPKDDSKEKFKDETKVDSEVENMPINFLDKMKAFLPKANPDDLKKASSELYQEDLDSKRNELIQYYLQDRSILKNDVSDIKLIKTMTLEDLESHIELAKQGLTSNFNDSISDLVLLGMNTIVGKSLKCLDRLKQRTGENIELKNTLKNVISTRLMFAFPDHLRLGILYIGDIIKSKNPN